MIENEIFEMILEKYYDEILLYCLSILGDNQSAEDCVQEVFLLLYQKRKKLYLSAVIRSWLYKTAANIVKRHLKNAENTAFQSKLKKLDHSGLCQLFVMIKNK
ncbi:RNA polymerase sigma factor [Ruminococcus flavefaciens]|uniref:RNA polymerase sigma factor n=1 Tax=Ruminococcus flavefaciens TaxID=1265 RepID=UPI0015632C34|nr:sigma-70 family RNA polymerase sigma factor [Ruminococcus flavefaciens]